MNKTEQTGSEPPGASAVAAAAARELQQLSGRDAEGISGIERTDDGWRVHVEVVELERIPHSTDVLAEYAVELDKDANVTGYRRVRRYHRGATRED